MAPLDSRQQLLLSIQGQEMYLPDLWPYFAHWPTAVNAGIDRLRKDESDWLDAYVYPTSLIPRSISMASGNPIRM